MLLTHLKERDENQAISHIQSISENIEEMSDKILHSIYYDSDKV